MKINADTDFNGPQEITQFVRDALDASGYESAQTVINSIDAIGRLCDVLSTKGIISASDVVFIAEGYKEIKSEFVK